MRLISAAVGIPIVLLAIWAGVPGVAALALVASLLVGYELCELAGARAWERPLFILNPPLIVLGQIWDEIDDSAIVFVPLVVMWIPVGISMSVSIIRADREKRLFQFAVSWVPPMFVFAAPLSLATPLVDFQDGRPWLLLAILGTFAVDTGAYFTGRAIGKRLLAPKISPKKTWEGVGGGLAAGIGAIIALTAVFDLPVAVWQAVLIGIAMTVAGVAGDLFESWLKRRANVKDSGKIIPGHGGILDRIDSLAPNLAVVYWAARIIVN